MDRSFGATGVVQVKLNLTNQNISLKLSTDMRCCFSIFIYVCCPCWATGVSKA